MTALLLAAGANPDDGESVYHATEEPELRCLALLLDAGATVPGTNALGHALDRPDTAALEMLLPHVGADPATLRGLIPGAIWRERGPEFLRLLAAAGADVEETGSPGDGLRSHAAEANRRRRPYAIAVHIGRPDLAAVLAELGAEPVADPIDELVGAAVRGDRAAAAALVAGDPALRERLVADHAEMLVRSAAEGRAAGVALLHDLGVPLDTRGQLSGTALHHAAWHGDAEVVELLIDRGAPIDLPAPDTGGGTPLQWAAHGSVHGPAGAHRVVGERLVDAGAQVSAGIVEAATGELADWLESLAAEPRGRRRFDRDDRHGWGERDVAVHAAYLRALAALPESETRAVGDGFAVRTGVASNTENGVVAGAASDEEVAAAIAFLRGAPAQWVLTGSGATVGGAASTMAGAAGAGDPAALHDRLVAAGAQPERSAVVMGARVAALDLAGAPPAGVAIAPSDDLDAWLDLAARLGWLDDDAADRAGRRATLRAPGVRHWLAHRDGAPIGLATAFLHHDTLAGLHLGVLPEHRRQGVARALIRAALADTPAARVALLAPTRTTEPLYARLGFTTVPSPPDRVLYLPD
jgi:GNAT superfamily N-acetyltransferase